MAEEPIITDKEKWQLNRMLVWFKTQLPRHVIGKWVFACKPWEAGLVDESGDTYLVVNHYGSIGVLVGHGECLSCGRNFELRTCGNFTIHDASEQQRLAKDYPSLTTAALIAEAKEWIKRDAEQAGECWGGVPALPRLEECSFVTLEAKPE